MKTDFKHYSTVSLFRKSIYLLCFYRTITLFFLPINFWGATTLPGGIKSIEYPWIFYSWMISQLIAIILGWCNIFPRFMALYIWYVTSFIAYGKFFINTSGDSLICIYLFFLLFIHPEKENHFLSKGITNLFNQTFFKALQLQVLLIYIVSSWHKWLDPDWVHGSAVEKIMQIGVFTFPLFQYEELSTLFLIMTWFSLIYQTFFPIVIWFSKIKDYLLLIGIGLHLGIALVMGLFEFGIIMIVSYLLFRSEEKNKQTLAKLPRLLQ